MAEIPGIQVRIEGTADGLKKAISDASNSLGTLAKTAKTTSQQLNDSLVDAAQSVGGNYGSLFAQLATSLSGLVNPAALASAAVAGIGAALLAYFNSLRENVPTVDEAISNHSKLISNVKKAYGDALTGLEEYTKESENSFRNRIGASVSLLESQIESVASTLTRQFGPLIQQVMYEAGSNTQSFLDVFISLPRKFEPFRAAIDEFQRTVRAGNPDFVAFKNAVDEIGAASAGVNPQLNATANALSEAAKQGFEMQRGIDAGKSALVDLAPEARKAAEALGAYNSALKNLMSIAPARVTDRYKADEEYLRAIQNAGGDENKIRQAVQARNDTLARIEAEEASKVKPISLRADNSADQLAREQEMITKRLEMLVVGWGTEEEKLAAHLIRNQDLINQANEKKVIDDETHKILMLGAEEEYQKRIQSLRDKTNTMALRSTASMFGSLQSLTESFGKKNTALSKAFGISQALINTYVGVTQALRTLPPPASYAAAAATLAQGLAQVASIRSVSDTGKGGGGASSSSGAMTSAANSSSGGGQTGGNSVYVNLQGQTFGRDQVRDLVKQIADFQADGGQVVFA
jgi:hypothetical protein